MYGIPSPAQRSRCPLPVNSRPSGVPAVMGPPNHAPGMPVMGASSPGLHLDVMGSPNARPDLDPMGGPDTGRRLHLLGESDPAFTDSLFAHRRWGVR
jgi:hypothetical protein